MPCQSCRIRHKCQTPCDKLEVALGAPEVEDIQLIFFEEVREDMMDWGEQELAKAKFFEEKQSLKRALRPLADLDKKTALVIIGRFYFGCSIKELARIFKLGQRRVYDVLREAEDAMGRVPNIQDVQKSRRDTRNS